MSTKNKNRMNRKRFLYQQQGGRCAYCNKPLSIRQATLDHVVPKCMGGPATRENQKVACKPCNCKKADKPPHVWYGLLMQGLVA